MGDKYTRIDLDDRGLLRSREIQLLVNIVNPDPAFQPWYLSDDATLFDIRDQREKIFRPRLEGYFGTPLRFDLKLPLWMLVDQIKEMYPGWPDDWE